MEPATPPVLMSPETAAWLTQESSFPLVTASMSAWEVSEKRSSGVVFSRSSTASSTVFMMLWNWLLMARTSLVSVWAVPSMAPLSWSTWLLSRCSVS